MIYMQCCCGESATVHCLAELAWYFIHNNYVVLAVAVFMWLHLCCIMPSRMCGSEERAMQGGSS